MKYKMLIIILIISVLLSCYHQKIILNTDKKSGTIIINYNLNDDYFQLLSIALDNIGTESNNEIDPAILIDEDIFKESFDETDEIKLKSVRISNKTGYKGEIIIEFKDLEKILEKLPQGLTNLNFIKNKDGYVLSQTLNLKEMDSEGIFKKFILQQKEDDINFYNLLTKDAKFEFEIDCATPIKKSEGVVLSKNKKSANYTFNLNEFINNENKILKFLISL